MTRTENASASFEAFIPAPANDSGAPPLDPRLAALVEEHGDLDGAIAALLASGNWDDLQMTRLKKRKLAIKDEIAAL